MKPKSAQTTEQLANSGHRPTAQRVIIYDALCTQKKTVTAQELFNTLRLKHPYIGRATVFRTIDALVESGLAQRFERDGHVYTYAVCSPEHHHHLVCEQCETTTEIGEDVVRPLIANLRKHYGFSVEHGSLDFYGVCNTCAERNSTAR